MKVAIIGSRTFNDFSLLKESIEKLSLEITEIISGGAKGADSLGEKYAIENNIPTKIFYPDWDKHGKKAGYLRNIDIISNSDVVIAFWDSKSKGTKHSIDLARENKKRLFIIKI